MDLEKVKKATVRIQCCENYENNLDINTKDIGAELSIGTGFFIDNDKVVTATHVIDGFYTWNYNIYIEAINIGIDEPIRAFPICKDGESFPITILQLEKKVDIEGLKFTFDYTINVDDKWKIFGYPRVKWNNGHRQEGTVSHRLDAKNSYSSNYDLNYNPGVIKNFEGLSGSAFIIDDMLLGVMMEQSLCGGNSTSLGALTIDEFLEYIPKQYKVKDKHKEEIKQYLRKYTERQIDKNEINKKYIPNIFVEIGSIKEKLRFFSNPKLFYEKIIEDIEGHNFESINYYLRKINLDIIEIKVPESLKKDVKLNNVYSKAKELEDIIDKTLENAKETEQKYNSKSKHGYLNSPRVEWYIKGIKELIQMFSYSYVLLTEKAGQGKTNLLCDFAERVLLSNQINTIYVNANEFNELTIEEYMNRKILNNFGYCLEVFLKNIEDICERDGVPFIIIIDGLNENSNINKFKIELESFIEAIVKYDYIKVIMTCRTEYFQERFGNLIQSSFSNKLCHFDNFNNNINDEFKDRLVSGYLQFFNLAASSIKENALEKLSKDLLLLRVFCEAYGDNEANLTIVLPPIYDIYKFDVFERYFKYKLQEIDRKESTVEGISNSDLYKLLVNQIINNMINTKKFNNVPQNTICDINQRKLLGKLIDEDIIFRQDIVKQKGLLKDTENTISFTFDEFRDYNIARNLMEKYGEVENEEYFELMKSLTDENYEISEGVSKYLFFASKKYKNVEFENIIKQQKWYAKIYSNNIFAVNDDDITEEDVKRIKNAFTVSIEVADYFISELLKRYDTNIFKKLGINLLYEIILNLDKNSFNKYIRDVFEDYEDHYGYIQRNYNNARTPSISEYLCYLYKILKKCNNVSAEHSLFKFVLFILDIDYDCTELYEEYFKKYPNEALEAIENLINIKNENIYGNLVSIIQDLSNLEIKLNVEIHDRLDVLVEKVKESYNDKTFNIKEFLK